MLQKFFHIAVVALSLCASLVVFASRDVENQSKSPEQMTLAELKAVVDQLLVAEENGELGKKEKKKLKELVELLQEKQRQFYVGLIKQIHAEISEKIESPGTYYSYAKLYMTMAKDPEIERYLRVKREWFYKMAAILKALHGPAKAIYAAEELKEKDMSKATKFEVQAVKGAIARAQEDAPKFQKLIQMYNELYKDRDKYRVGRKKKRER